jgi:hypothetical protein
VTGTAGAAVLTMKYGIVGGAAAWTLRALADSLLLNMAVQKWRRPISPSVDDILRMSGLQVFLLPPVIAMILFEVRWIWTTFLTCVCLLFYSISLWLRILTSAERSWITTMLRRLLPQAQE